MSTLQTRRPTRRPATAPAGGSRSPAGRRGTGAQPGAGSRTAGTRSGSARPGENAALSYYLIGGAALLLVVIGVVSVFSASIIDAIASGANPYVAALGQGQFALIGLLLCYGASRVPVAWYRRLAWPALLLGLALQLLIYTPLGRRGGGSLLGVYLPGVNQVVQPAEFLKVALAVWLGLVLSRKLRQLHDWRHVVVPGALGAMAAAGLVLGGGDLGTVLVIVTMVAGAHFVAGLPLRWFGAAAMLGAGVVTYLVIATPHRMNRVMYFLGMSEDDPAGVGYQTLHGLRALGTGGWSGVGLGASREKWAYLPEAHTDYILAVIGEELGLLGTLLVLALFGVLAVGLFRVVRRHRDPFVQITTAAIATWILAQALINIGVVIDLLPVVGVPLPLVSSGGSALIATLLGLGIVLSFARSEPGAAKALATRQSVVSRSLAVVGRGRRG